MSSPCDFDDDLVAHSMNIDDAYRVEKLLARGRGGVTGACLFGRCGSVCSKEDSREDRA